MGKKLWKIGVLFECHKVFKENSHIEITNKNKPHHLDIKGIAHFEFIPQGQTANQAYYVEI